MIVEILARYWAKVDRRGDDDCWIWRGARTAHGYGQIGAGGTYRGRPIRALATHVALAIDGRPRPSEAHVAMHRCDNPHCVNPRHLQWGTHRENMEDMRAKGRSAAQVRAAAQMDEAALWLGRSGVTKLTPDQVRYIRTSDKTLMELADELGVTNQCVSLVRQGKTWAKIK
jgi:hypothetical protein